MEWHALRREEFADRLGRRERCTGAEPRHRPGDEWRLQRRNAHEPPVRIERRRAIEAERGRWIERERLGDARLGGADCTAPRLRLRIGDAKQHHLALAAL